MVAAYERGASMNGVGRKFGLSGVTIHRVFKELGVVAHHRRPAVKPEPITAEEMSEARALLTGGRSLADAAAYVGCTSADLDLDLWRQLGEAAA